MIFLALTRSHFLPLAFNFKSSHKRNKAKNILTNQLLGFVNEFTEPPVLCHVPNNPYIIKHYIYLTYVGDYAIMVAHKK